MEEEKITRSPSSVIVAQLGEAARDGMRSARGDRHRRRRQGEERPARSTRTRRPPSYISVSASISPRLAAPAVFPCMSFAWPRYTTHDPSAVSPVASTSRLPALGVPPTSEGPTSPGSYAGQSHAPPSPSAGSVLSETAGGERSASGKRYRSRGLRE